MFRRVFKICFAELSVLACTHIIIPHSLKLTRVTYNQYNMYIVLTQSLVTCYVTQFITQVKRFTYHIISHKNLCTFDFLKYGPNYWGMFNVHAENLLSQISVQRNVHVPQMTIIL